MCEREVQKVSLGDVKSLRNDQDSNAIILVTIEKKKIRIVNNKIK